MASLTDDLAEFAEAFFRDPQTDECPPYQLEHLWLLYLDIAMWRGFDMELSQPRALSIETLANWTVATGRRFEQFEMDVLMRLDGAYWDALAKGPVQEKTGLFDSMKQVAKEFGKVKTVPMNIKKATEHGRR